MRIRYLSDMGLHYFFVGIEPIHNGQSLPKEINLVIHCAKDDASESVEWMRNATGKSKAQKLHERDEVIVQVRNRFLAFEF